MSAYDPDYLPYGHFEVSFMLHPRCAIFGPGDRRAAEVLKRICELPRNRNSIMDASGILDDKCQRFVRHETERHGHHVWCTVSGFDVNDFGKIFTTCDDNLFCKVASFSFQLCTDDLVNAMKEIVKLNAESPILLDIFDKGRNKAKIRRLWYNIQQHPHHDHDDIIDSTDESDSYSDSLLQYASQPTEESSSDAETSSTTFSEAFNEPHTATLAATRVVGITYGRMRKRSEETTKRLREPSVDPEVGDDTLLAGATNPGPVSKKSRIVRE